MKAYKNPSLAPDERAHDLLSALSLDEKIAQLCCRQFRIERDDASPTGYRISNLDEIGDIPPGQFALDFRCDGFEPVCVINELQRYYSSAARVFIPLFGHTEGCHSINPYTANLTAFPTPPALASSFDTELMHEIYTQIAKEARSNGYAMVFAPVLDVIRDARYGRVDELYSEDAYLNAVYGQTVTTAINGDIKNGYIDGEHAASTAKHYAGYSYPEGGLNGASSLATERTFRDVFLYPFKKAVEAGLQGVMPSYSALDGEGIHGSERILRRILREELGFDGVTVSDYSGIKQLKNALFIAEDDIHAAALAINAGLDMDLPSGDCYRHIREAVDSSLVSENVIDESVFRILRLKFRLGLFDRPLTDETLPKNNAAALALKAAQEGAVLLKNDGVLPFDREKIKSLAVIGPNADEVHFGTYSGYPRDELRQTILSGIRSRVGSIIDVKYARGCNIIRRGDAYREFDFAPIDDDMEVFVDMEGEKILPVDPDEEKSLIAEAVQLAGECDAVVLVLGENEHTCREGWGGNRGDRASLDLLGLQNQLAARIFELGKPTVVLLSHGRPNSISYLARHAPAILETWFLGQQCGCAIADILFGDVNPSGKLPQSVPRSAGHLPCYYSRTPRSLSDIYLFDSNTPLYPFGYGLSYTVFEYGEPSLSSDTMTENDTLFAAVTVTNAGTRDGAETVQLYIRDDTASVTRPCYQLKGFKKVFLKSGESVRVELPINAEALSFTRLDMHFAPEKGSFTALIGSSSLRSELAELHFSLI